MGILAVIEGEGSGVIYRLGQRVLTIGRSPANLIQLLDPSVSRRHATILWDTAAYQIKDLKSKNGVLVNEAFVTEALLVYGDKVRVGQTLFKLIKDTGQVDQDSVLKRRVMSKEAVDSATIKLDREALKSALAAGSAPDPGAPAGNTEPVDVDAAAKAMDDRLQDDTTRLKAQAKGVTDVAKTINATLNYIIQTMDADRCIAYRSTGSRRLEMAGIATISHLDRERAAATPFAKTVEKAVTSRRPCVDNDVQDPVVFSAAAVPIQVNNDLVGVVYADSMRCNPRYFIGHDLEMLVVVSGVLDPPLSV